MQPHRPPRAVAAVLPLLLLCPPLAAQRAGEADGPLKPCFEHWDRGRRPEALRCYRSLLNSESDPRRRAEAWWKLGDLKQANEQFRAAVAARPKDASVRVAWGRLFLRAHDKAEASKLFQEALQLDADNPEALLGMALVASERFEGAAVDQASKALALDPLLAEAHTLLAWLALEEDDAKKAGTHLDRALASEGSPLEAYALKAAIDLLAGKAESEWIAKGLAYNPRSGQLYATNAHFFVINRKYREAVALYRKAVELDPELWAAHADLGVNLWRLGEEAQARRHLETAYGGDPFSPTVVNTLRLLDSMKRFRTFSNDRMIVKLHEKEAELLRPYVEELLGKAIDTFQKKYDHVLRQPVQLELFPDHEDFAVRTMGMPGLGALGVTFGHLVAMDSPSAKPPGAFHWGSTLWHELSHVFVLGLTNHRVPRWISEGLAVYEETVAGPGWGDRLTPEVIRAIAGKKLLPVEQLDRGFVRPRYPSQVVVSYFQAGAICEMVAEKWGFPKLLAMVRGYAQGRSTGQVIQQELAVSPAELDRQFTDFVKARTEKVVSSFEPEWLKQMELVVKLAKEKKFAEVIEPARRVRDLYPDYVQAGNPYEILAEALLAAGDKAGAAQELDRYRIAGGHSPRALKQLASLLEQLGRRAQAIQVLEQLLWIRPGDEELHRRLGELLLEEKQPRRAVREFSSLLAARSLDPAAAHFNLARAFHQLQDREKTREHLLEALEAAPGYRPAQKLLLEINR